MRLVIAFSALAAALAAFAPVMPAIAQEEDEEEAPKKKSFDVFGDEDEEEPPEGEAPAEEAPAEEAPEPPPEKPKPLEGPKTIREATPAEEPVEERPPEVAPVVAAGDPVLVLLIPEMAQSASLAFRLGEGTTRLLAKERGLRPLDLERALFPTGDVQQKEDIRIGLAAIQRGLNAFGELDLDTAGSELDSGINALLAYIDDLDPAGRRALENAIFCFGATTLFAGQTDLAESIFVALLLEAPRYSPNAEDYPSNVIARFEDLRRKVEQLPTGGLTINTTPRGADVYVDGSFRGASPIEVGGLADGQHIVVVKRVGSKPFGTLAPVTADRSASVDVDLEDMPNGEVFASLRDDLAADVQAALQLGGKLGASRFAVLKLTSGLSGVRVTGLWLDVKQGRLLGRIEETKLAADPDVAAKVLVAAIVASESAPLVAETEKVGDSTPITEAWWFWTLIGAAAVAGGTAIVVAASSRDRGPPSNGIVLGF